MSFTLLQLLMLLGFSSWRGGQAWVLHKGVSTLVDKYDCFILDQWGVLHDGKTLYSDVLNSLQQLRRAGKKLIMLSNSSKRVSSSLAGLQKVGIDPDFFFDNDVVTSGELAWQQLHNSAKSPLNVFVVGGSGSVEEDEEYVLSSGNRVMNEPSLDTDLVLARGTFSIGRLSFESAEEMMRNIDEPLQKCRAFNLPLLVTNPDYFRPGSGAPMPGQIGNRYAALGGSVQSIGKPYSAVFDECLRRRPQEVPHSRVCMVGDSLDHDVRGANRYGHGRIDSVWISNGIHSSDLGTKEGAAVLADRQRLETFLQAHDSEAQPTHILPAFQW